MLENKLNHEIVIAKLAEWGIKLNESEVGELVKAYQKTLQWQAMLENMLQQREVEEGIFWPESEPLLIHYIDKWKG